LQPDELLAPLQGQREETLRVIDSLSEADLERRHESGRSVRDIFAHIASAELGEAFFIRRAAAGDLIPMSTEDRDRFNDDEMDKAAGWDLARIRSELDEARTTLLDVFRELVEDDLERPIRWPEWPARTIRASIPYMVEHEDSHVDEVRKALDRD
jgi:uncharacterized damage-inducible protein DinB